MMMGRATSVVTNSIAGLRKNWLSRWPISRPLRARALRQVRDTGHVERFPRRELHVVDAQIPADPPDVGEEAVELFEVRLPQRLRIDEEPGVAFEALEQSHPLERERQLVVVEHVEDDHFVPFV